jgi:hypothetical protein
MTSHDDDGGGHDGPLLTDDRAAEWAVVSPRTLQRVVTAGESSAVRLGDRTVPIRPAGVTKRRRDIWCVGPTRPAILPGPRCSAGR